MAGKTTSKRIDTSAYPFTIRPLSEEEGGGYLIEFPDVQGCVSDAEAPGEAIRNGRDALNACLATMREFGAPLPARRRG
jgi:antitoxin HicB